MKDTTRRSWVNFTLIAVACIAALAVVVTRTTWTSAEREARSSHLVVGFRSGDVDRVEVVNAGKRVVIVRDAPGDVEREGDDHAVPGHDHARFHILEPFQGEAEEAVLDGLLHALELATVLRRVDEANFDRAAAGLDDPEQVIHLYMADVEVRLSVGKEASAPKGSRYVEVAGQGVANRGVYVVSESTVADLSVTPDAFRIKQLVPFAASALRAVVLRSASRPDVRLSYDEAHASWRVEYENQRVRVSRVAWERLFAAFARSELERFVSADIRVDAPRAVQVEFTPKQADLAPLSIAFGGACPSDPELEFAAKLAPEPLVGCTRALHLDTFVNQPETLIDLQLLSARSDEIEEVVITRGDKVLELARRNAAWIMRQPQEGNVEREVGQAFVASLAALGGELSDAPVAPELDVKVVVRTGSDGKTSVREQSFELTRETVQGVFVHRLDDDVWLKVAPNTAQQLVPFDLLLRQSSLTSFDANDLKQVSLTTTEWQQRFAVTEQGKSCKLEAPLGFEADPSLCLDVMDTVRSLRAQSWVAASQKGPYGFEAPLLTAEWRLQDDAVRRLTVGGRAKDGGYYAALDDTGPVFTLSRSTVEALTTLVVSRSAFVLDPELLQEVRVRTASRVVELTRLGDDFLPKPTSASDVALTPTRVRALIDALGLLKAEAAVELVPSGALAAPTTSKQHARAPLGLAEPLLEVEAALRQADGGVRHSRFKVGAGDVYRNMSVYYAEPVTSEPHAVFVLPRAAVARVLEALD